MNECAMSESLIEKLEAALATYLTASVGTNKEVKYTKFGEYIVIGLCVNRDSRKPMKVFKHQPCEYCRGADIGRGYKCYKFTERHDEPYKVWEFRDYRVFHKSGYEEPPDIYTRGLSNALQQKMLHRKGFCVTPTHLGNRNAADPHEIFNTLDDLLNNAPLEGPRQTRNLWER